MFKKTLIALALCLSIVLPALAATPVDVNHANAQTIAASLDGIGMSKAKAIVAYRNAHGPFKSVDDLGNVKGVGTKTLARNHAAIRLHETGTSPSKAGSKDQSGHK
jgi:competence protein ComEA